MSFSKNFIRSLSCSQIDSLYEHYKKYISSMSSDCDVSFLDWIDSYQDIPNILRSMCFKVKLYK